jgi:hypothetical protein
MSCGHRRAVGQVGCQSGENIFPAEHTPGFRGSSLLQDHNRPQLSGTLRDLRLFALPDSTVRYPNFTP